MKKLLITLIITTGLSACASQSYKLSANDIQYIEDQRSGLCFAIVNARSSKLQIGMTTVDCNDVEDLLAAEQSPVAGRPDNQVAEKQPTRNYYNINPSFSSF